MKERLVGAAVLVAIAVWLIPWVLDGPEDGTEAPASSLQLPSAEEPMPMRTQTLRLGDAPETATQPAATAAPESSAPEAMATVPPQPSETESRPEAEAQPTVVAIAPAAEHPAPVPTPAPEPPAPPKKEAAAAGDWTVQLGSFGEEANARRLAQRASTFGYEAKVSSHRSGGRTLYRVRVGPQATRGAADAAASALRAHGLDARVVAAR